MNKCRRKIAKDKFGITDDLAIQYLLIHSNFIGIFMCINKTVSKHMQVAVN